MTLDIDHRCPNLLKYCFMFLKSHYSARTEIKLKSGFAKIMWGFDIVYPLFNHLSTYDTQYWPFKVINILRYRPQLGLIMDVWKVKTHVKYQTYTWVLCFYFLNLTLAQQQRYRIK